MKHAPASSNIFLMRLDRAACTISIQLPGAAGAGAGSFAAQRCTKKPFASDVATHSGKWPRGGAGPVHAVFRGTTHRGSTCATCTRMGASS
jgi:hypothetical protein